MGACVPALYGIPVQGCVPQGPILEVILKHILDRISMHIFGDLIPGGTAFWSLHINPKSKNPISSKEAKLGNHSISSVCVMYSL